MSLDKYANSAYNGLPMVLLLTIFGTETALQFMHGLQMRNGTSGWSATNTVDITVQQVQLQISLVIYTLTTTHGLSGCNSSDVVAVTVNAPTISNSASLSSFTACSGSNSAEQSFTTSGTYFFRVI